MNDEIKNLKLEKAKSFKEKLKGFLKEYRLAESNSNDFERSSRNCGNQARTVSEAFCRYIILDSAYPDGRKKNEIKNKNNNTLNPLLEIVTRTKDPYINDDREREKLKGRLIYIKDIGNDASHENNIIIKKDDLDEIKIKLLYFSEFLFGKEFTENITIDEDDGVEENNEAQKIIAVKKSLENIDLDRMKKIAYKYLTHTIYKKLPNTSHEIIDYLLKYGASDQGVPIVSILEEIENIEHNENRKKFIDYLKNVKYKDQETQCIPNKEISELSLLIHLSKQYGKNEFKIEIWRYESGETINDNLGCLPEIDLNNAEHLNNFFNSIDSYLKKYKPLLMDRSKIYVEIIMPVGSIYNSIKNWNNTKGTHLIRKYKHLFRMESRFIQNDNSDWDGKWKELNKTEKKYKLNDEEKSILVTSNSYDYSIVDDTHIAILEEEIDNFSVLFEDIEDFGIPVVLSSLSEQCNVEELKSIIFNECQQKICSHIMHNHRDYKSDIFFMVDDPNKIPEKYKNPELSQYG